MSLSAVRRQDLGPLQTGFSKREKTASCCLRLIEPMVMHLNVVWVCEAWHLSCFGPPEMQPQGLWPGTHKSERRLASSQLELCWRGTVA